MTNKKNSGFGESAQKFKRNDDPFAKTHDIEPRSSLLDTSQDGFEDTFTPTEAKEAAGNFIVTVGRAKSGKSTFHSTLFRYIETSGLFEYKLLADPKDLSMMRRMSIWRENWMERTNLTATPTRERDIHKISYQTSSVKGPKVPFGFNIVEISGELLEVLDGTNGEIKIPATIHNLLDNQDVKITLILMIDPETPRNDLLFKNLINYIAVHFPILAQNLPTVVLIPKPLLALEHLQKVDQSGKYDGLTSLSGSSKVDFLKSVSPGVLSHLRTLPKKNKLLMPLYVGQFSERPDSEGDGIEEYLVAPNFEDIKIVFNWLHKKYTGRNPGETWLGNVIKNLDAP
ncbi:hypothetical protein F9L33_09590 [Amylibacter sp. SFDW26]|uniref:hypothetical protein n=1 Tax=Amylibacter sp. SFDW26 TaxID=2652722 RepID=UPI0012617234|nr:hypothetical protein [Amylibacter sp. SFDW26]KAB7613622.1 hypothetical protein F9L33_09590 [Amylibacter sp. SFDW26]